MQHSQGKRVTQLVGDPCSATVVFVNGNIDCGSFKIEI